VSARPDGATLVALDLDSTLLYSARSLKLPDADLLAPRLLVAEVWRGAPLTYCTQRTEMLLGELQRAAVVVPVTTRTLAQYARVRLFDGSGPASAHSVPRYAIVANGGHLLLDGRPDDEWAGQVRAALADDCGPLDEVVAALKRATDGHRTSDVRVADDLFAYVAVDPATWPGSALDDLTGWCVERGWRVSLQGRRLYCVPRPLTKAAAVAEVARRVGAATLLAAGDSVLDQDLLALADYAVRPAHGELHALDWRPPHLEVTGSTGVLAGEEIVRRLLQLVLHRPSDEIVSTDAWQ
jgi:hypothetical protein